MEGRARHAILDEKHTPLESLASSNSMGGEVLQRQIMSTEKTGTQRKKRGKKKEEKKGKRCGRGGGNISRAELTESIANRREVDKRALIFEKKKDVRLNIRIICFSTHRAP